MSKIISVLMPIKKIDKYLDISLGSILNQSFQDFEIIIVVDENKSVLFQDYIKLNFKHANLTKIKIIESKIQGIAAALNIGLQHCNSEFIARMDSDDISDANRLQKQVDYLHENEKYKIIAARVRYIDSNGRVIGSSKKKSGNIYKQMCFGNIVSHPTVMMRTNFIRKMGGYSNISSEDFDLWTRCLIEDQESIFIMNEELLSYRIHENQLSIITNIKSQTAVCAILFNVICQNFNVNILFGIIFNIIKLLNLKKSK
jgi:glycosyltransferase involved in cell wall biosynthesis